MVLNETVRVLKGNYEAQSTYFAGENDILEFFDLLIDQMTFGGKTLLPLCWLSDANTLNSTS